MMRTKAFAALVCAVLMTLPAHGQEVTGRFKLTNQDGTAVSETSYDGSVRVVTFGYTFCPDICPTTLSTVASALDMLGPKGDQVVPLFVTVDPKRDTAGHLKDYVNAFGPRFVGLTGTTEQIDAAARAFRVRYVLQPPQDPADPNSYFVDHSAGIYIMDRKGGFAAKLGHRADPEDLAARLTEVMER